MYVHLVYVSRAGIRPSGGVGGSKGGKALTDALHSVCADCVVYALALPAQQGNKLYCGNVFRSNTLEAHPLFTPGMYPTLLGKKKGEMNNVRE